MLEQHLEEEKLNRENWMSKFLEEQKNQIDANQELLNTKTELKEVGLSF